MQKFFETQNELLKNLSNKKRYLFNEIDFNERLIWLIWPRWVGKTTMLLQYILEKNIWEKGLYISADNIYFLENNLYEFVEKFYREYEWELLIIDEIHKYKNWSQELKNIYDSFPKMNIIFSWSSSLDLKIWNYDLSRRAKLYHLEWFSFREYLNFNYEKNFSKINFQEILEKNFQISTKISNEIAILKYFKEYLKFWYYPYFNKKNISEYWKVMETIEKTIFEDISNFYDLKSQNLLFFKKILNYLAVNPPWTININKISKTLELDNKTVSHYLEILKKVWLVRFLLKDEFWYSIMKNTKKIFLDNSILYFTINSFLNKEVNIWTIRENFVLNQIWNSIKNISYSKIWDLKIYENIFEIWGKNKNFSQIKDEKNSYLILDDILIWNWWKIPIWMFGFLY